MGVELVRVCDAGAEEGRAETGGVVTDNEEVT